MHLGDVAVVGHGRPAHRVGAELQARVAHRIEVEHVGQVPGVRVEEVVGAGAVLRQGGLQGDPSDAGHAVGDDLVGAVLDPAGGLAAGRPAVRRVVLEPAIGRRVVRRGDHDAVREAVGAPPVVGQDRVAQGRGGRVPVPAVDADLHVVGRQHLERRDPRGLGQAVRVLGQEQRAVGALHPPVLHDRLGGGQDVELVEGRLQAGPAVPGRAEGNPLVDVLGVGLLRVVQRDQLRDVDEVAVLGRESGALVGHGTSWFGGGGRATHEAPEY